MPTASFVKAKKTGRWFEAQVRGVLREVGKEKGIEVIDSENLSYRQKKGWDCEVRLASGARCKVEVKLDQMSEATGNVCLELLALDQSISPIWVYGLPSEGQICLYTAYRDDLRAFAQFWPIKRPVGEYGVVASLIPKGVFLSQPFVKKFKIIKLN
jgi:hypothetical protein